jgi:hypothetical protein
MDIVKELTFTFVEGVLAKSNQDNNLHYEDLSELPGSETVKDILPQLEK